MKVTVKMTGDKALIGSLSLMDVGARMQLERLVDKSSTAVLAGALARVPRRTNELAKTLRRKIAPSGLSAEIMAGYGVLAHKGKSAVLRAKGVKANEGKGVYAAAVEFGTQHSAAEPYLFPALEAERPTFMRGCADALNGTLATAERAG